MWLKLIESFAWCLEKLGRKDMMVNRFGQIRVQRFYPFLMPPTRTKGRKGWNFALHKFPAGHWNELPHDHGREAWSFILSGGYTEEVMGVERKREQFTFAKLGLNEFHSIKYVKPNTWTLFFVGRWHREYQMLTDGLGSPIMTRAELLAKDKKKLLGYHLDSPEVREKIRKRQLAVERLNRRKIKPVEL